MYKHRDAEVQFTQQLGENYVELHQSIAIYVEEYFTQQFGTKSTEMRWATTTVTHILLNSQVKILWMLHYVQG